MKRPSPARRAAAGQQYAIIVGLVGVVALLSVNFLGTGVRGLMTSTSNTLGGVVNGATAGGPSGGGGGGGGGPSCSGTPRDCATILSCTPGSSTGIYTIDPDGPGSVPSQNVYCDMTTDGGGWTLISKFSGIVNTGRSYFAGNAFGTLVNLTISTNGDNAMMAHAGIEGIINGRQGTTVTFRAVSSFADTQIQMVTTGKSPFGYATAGDNFRCRQSSTPTWTDYTMSFSGCQVLNGTTARVLTWVEGCTYISPTSGNQPCGDGHIFSTPTNHPNQEFMQWIDGGYTAAPTRPGVWYIR